MAQTRTITRKKLAALGLLDLASRPLHLAWRPPPPRTAPPGTFLVVEPWGIGDVVVATPMLASLRAAFPSARITLLGKPYASELLANSGLVDDVVSFDFPWTAFTGKYRLSRYEVRAFDDLFRGLRRRDFDVSLDARRDIRSNIVTYLAGARRRIGFDFGGGSHFLTDVLPSGDQNAHKIDDWLSLLEPLGITEPAVREPRLTVTAHESEMARAKLGGLGINVSLPLIGLHPGARHRVRRWDQSRYAEVVNRLMSSRAAQFVIFEETAGDSAEIITRQPIPRLRGSIREMMAFIAQCSLFLANDSGPMHIAEALGIPVTAIFGGSRHDWYGPRGPRDEKIFVADMPCRPCFDACIFATPRCLEGVSADQVFVSVSRQLARLQ